MRGLLLLLVGGAACAGPLVEDTPHPWGVHLALNLSTLTPTADLPYPETGWQAGGTLGGSYDYPLNPVLTLRGLAEFGVGGATLDANGIEGHVELWTLKVAPLFLVQLPSGPHLRPFMQLGPWLNTLLLARAELGGYAPDLDARAPYAAFDWGVSTGLGAHFEAGGQAWSVDARLDLGLGSIAAPGYPAFAEVPEAALRSMALQAGGHWHF